MRRSPLRWLLVAGAVGVLLILVAFAASGGLSWAPQPILRPDNGAAPPAATQTSTPAPSPTPAPVPAHGGDHGHGHGGGGGGGEGGG